MKSMASQIEREVDVSTGYTDLPSQNIRETQRKIGRNSIESSLTLLKPLPSHSGAYRCHAFNGLDNDSRSVEVIIQGELHHYFLSSVIIWTLYFDLAVIL